MLLSKLNEVSLKQHHEDTKHWEIKRSGKYTVKYCNTLMKKVGYPGISFFFHTSMEMHSPFKI
jgi:hypothetical protein